jgi:hypothetical protein
MCDQLKEKFNEWREWLLGEDVHSIRKQIHSMIWDSAVYQSINEARAFAAPDDEGQIQLNGMVHQFIDRCFFDTQMMAVRRLLDKETRPGERSVTSLWRLLDDMERNVCSLTRENILVSLGLPYDYERTREEVLKRYAEISGVRIMGDDYKQCVFSEDVHKRVDSLAGINASQRGPTDTMRVGVIQWLKERLGECKAIYEYVNKFLAHSATPESRARLMDEETKITLGQILDAHEVICQIAEFVGQNVFLRSVGNPLPVPQFNQFEHFEKAWVTEEALKKLHEWWHSYYASTSDWLKWDWQSEYAAYGASSSG